MTDEAAGAPRREASGWEAPVAYADIRQRMQRARLAAALSLGAMAAYLWLSGETEGPLPLIAAAVVLGDSFYRMSFGHRAVWSFLVDALAIGVIIGIDDGVLAPLIALLAYLLVGTILTVPQPGTIWVMAVAGAAFTAASFGENVMSTANVTTPTAASIWLHIAVMLLAAGTFLLGGASYIRTAARRQREALEAEKRASEMKTQFVSMVSHELRTPLTNISGFADTLSGAWRDLEGSEVDEFLDIIRTEAEHLGNLVDDVLAIPRLETGRLLVDITDFALRPLAFRIADLVFPGSGEKQASVQVPGNVVVKADPNRVEQVLRNLLDNARKYGGDRVGIECFPRGDAHVVVVADNGPGVPEEARTRIFEQFEQVSRGDSRTDSGVGLGLSVTKRLVEAMGGQVWYEPGFPVGARFCFSLPMGVLTEETSPRTTKALSA